MIRLIYASHSTRTLKKEDIDQILVSARQNNFTDGISGMLCYGNERFLQYLEGDAQSVQKIYDKILLDDRHEKVTMIDQNNLDRRVFGDWSMGFIDLNDILTKVTVLETTKIDGFFPEKMDASMALQLIKTLKSSLGNQVIVD